MGNSRWAAAKKYSFSHRFSSFFILLRASFKIYPPSFVVPFVEVGQYLLLFLVQISWQSRLSPQFPFLTAIYFLALIETSFPFSFSSDIFAFSVYQVQSDRGRIIICNGQFLDLKDWFDWLWGGRGIVKKLPSKRFWSVAQLESTQLIMAGVRRMAFLFSMNILIRLDNNVIFVCSTLENTE